MQQNNKKDDSNPINVATEFQKGTNKFDREKSKDVIDKLDCKSDDPHPEC